MPRGGAAWSARSLTFPASRHKFPNEFETLPGAHSPPGARPERPTMKKSILLPVLAACLALFGCAVLEGQDLSDDPVSDEGITSIASSRLNNDVLVARATLSVTVANGLATLHGTVPDEVTRRRAVQILAGTPGIFDVLDRTRIR